MSKIAIISDVHSNIDALNLVLKDIEKRNVDRIICLGDIVTKYFYPAETVDAIKENCDIVIKGNCDDFVVKNENYKFARNKLGLDRIEFLDSLPTHEQLLINKQLVNLYHSNPKSLDSMFNPLFNHNDLTRYKDNSIQKNEYEKMFIDEKPQTTIVGHTHNHYIALEDNKHLKIVKSPQIMQNIGRSIINVGSVGEHSNLVKTKTGSYEPFIDDYISYLIIDDKNLKSGFNVEIIKIPYKKELKKIFIDSVKGQKEGNFPYSPIFTERMGNAIKKYDENSIKMVDTLIDENITTEKLRKKGKTL